MKNTLFSIVLVIFTLPVIGQVGIGFTTSWDAYARFKNPDNDDFYDASGSAILNFGVGPKIWVGGESFSLSAEAQATISPLALALEDYKGLGMASFPVIAKLNFNGASGLNKEGDLGFSVGGGIQWTRTELFGLNDEFESQGVSRSLSKVYVGVLGYGFGISGFVGQVVAKYGVHPDTEANFFSLGLQFDFNVPKLRQISDPASEL